MKYLVTGSAGFIGKNLVKKLLENDKNFVYSFDKKKIGFKNKRMKHKTCDLTQQKTFPKVDIVFHLAAHNGTRFFYEKPIQVVNDNFNSTLNLVNFYSKNKCRLFVYAGSPESIAGTTDYFKMPLPSKEDYPVVIEDIQNPRWSYATSKALSELTVANSKLKYCILRYHNVYGPDQKDHFIPDFLHRCSKGKYVLKGYDNTRSFMYIDDAIEATVQVIKNKKCQGEIVNVGNDKETKIKEVKLSLLPAPKGSVKRRRPDLTKLKKIFKFESKVGLMEGLKKVCR
jgi:UDP-glucose 4-epimerase